MDLPGLRLLPPIEEPAVAEFRIGDEGTVTLIVGKLFVVWCCLSPLATVRVASASGPDSSSFSESVSFACDCCGY